MDLASKPRRCLATRPLLAVALALAGAATGCRRGPPAPPPARQHTRDAAALLGAPKAEPGPPPPRGKSIAVLYSSDLLAAYEACGCPVHPMGGLARRATQVDRARAESDAVLILDAGDLFLPAVARLQGKPPLDPGEIERRGRLLAGAFGRIGTTAFTPGERDLALGLPLLRKLIKQTKLPVISANLYGTDGQRLFDADRLVDAAGIKVGLFGVTAAPTAEDAAAWRAAGIEARDPAAAAREAVASLRARGAGVVIALGHPPSAPEARKLFESVPGLDWVVLGHTGLRLDPPEKVGAARLLSAMSDGKELGRLDLHVVGGSLAFADRGERAEVETILADHKRQLTDYDKRLGETDPATLRDYYETRRHEIEKAIARETALLERLPAAITGSWFENRILPLDAVTPDQNGVAILVDAYRRASAARAAAGKPVGVGTDRPPALAPPAAPPGAPPDAKPTYVGTAACGACHAPALAQWKTTKHAHAFEALVRIGKDKDPSCVGCHVTGYLQPGGWQWRDGARGGRQSPLANVSCEVCHGPGSGHVQAADKRWAAARSAPASVCLGCHTADITNGEFDAVRFTAAILGPGHGKNAPLAPGPRPPL